MSDSGDESRSRKAKHIYAMYNKTFGTPEGLDVLKDLMVSVSMMGPSLDLNNPDPQVTAFNEGAKSIVYRIIHQLNMDPEKYMELLEQTYEEEE